MHQKITHWNIPFSVFFISLHVLNINPRSVWYVSSGFWLINFQLFLKKNIPISRSLVLDSKQQSLWQREKREETYHRLSNDFIYKILIKLPSQWMKFWLNGLLSCCLKTWVSNPCQHQSRFWSLQHIFVWVIA